MGAPGVSPVQPPGVAQQPYGALQPLPQVNVPEQQVGQRAASIAWPAMAASNC